jgi:tRNA1(Val) A37 N6-methylase TrmN6
VTGKVAAKGAATTRDRILDGRLCLHQPASGHRVGLDAVLLANALRSAGKAVDLGAGVGSVGLIFATLNPHARVALVEREPDSLALARLNLAENGLEGRVTAIETDVFAGEAVRVAAGLGRETADLVLTNPPFAAEGGMRASPDENRRRAHVMQGGDLADWLRTAASCLRPGGHLAMIHRADALAPVLDACGARFGALTLRFVHVGEKTSAVRLLLLATKGSRAPLVIAPPIIIGEAGPDLSQAYFTAGMR